LCARPKAISGLPVAIAEPCVMNCICRANYWLQQPILYLLWASWTSFSVITSPNRNLCECNLERKCGAMVRTHTRKMGEIATGVRSRVPFFLLLKMQRVLSATYLAPILTIFETTDVNHFPHAYAGEFFFQFLRRGFSRSPKQPDIR